MIILILFLVLVTVGGLAGIAIYHNNNKKIDNVIDKAKQIKDIIKK